LDFITEETYNKIMTRGYPQIGDVLFTTEGATMGFTCRIPKGFDKFSIGQRLITLQANNNYNSAVLEYMLNSKVIQDEINSLATGSAVKGIRSAKFAKIKIPNPPISIQSQFAKCIDIIEQQKAQAQASLEKAEELFNSLLQRAFKGDLV
jgi:type I restriction enzyme S subunit